MLAPHQKQLIETLQKESTWKLFFLSLVTLGVYMAYYIRSRSALINEHLEETQKIPSGFVKFIFIWTWVSLPVGIGSLLMLENYTIQGISNAMDFVFSICILVWAFTARSRMNRLLGAEKGEEEWFHGLWTFLFPVLYFNYKINKLSKNI